jgi:hypothetical protein
MIFRADMSRLILVVLFEPITDSSEDFLPSMRDIQAVGGGLPEVLLLRYPDGTKSGGEIHKSECRREHQRRYILDALQNESTIQSAVNANVGNPPAHIPLILDELHPSFLITLNIPSKLSKAFSIYLILA